MPSQIFVPSQTTSKAFTFSLSTWALHGARLLLGLTFIVCGLNGFLNFIPPPSDPVPAAAMSFAGALLQTGYMFPLIKGSELFAGALLLSNRFVALALVLLAPITINIFAFHLFLTPGAVGLASILLALHLAMAWAHRAAYRALLKARLA